MQTMKPLLLLSAIMMSLGFFSSRVNSDEREVWREIKVMQSTRADVERLLEKPQNEDYLVHYALPDGSLDIRYSTGYCEPRQDGGWNVPEWTVNGITYRPFTAPKFSSLNLDLSRFKKQSVGGCTPDIIGYVDDEDGVQYTVDPDGTLRDIKYYPSSLYKSIQCEQIR